MSYETGEQAMLMRPAPELDVSTWLNTDEPITLASLRGRVILIEAFQMLCPGCVSHSLPQAKRVAAYFRQSDVAVLGLHTVFEHKDAQGSETALKAFLHEYRIGFPVGIDRQMGDARIPSTMSEYQMEGTPTTILIDAEGLLRKQFFGREEDLVLGAEISELIAEKDPANQVAAAASTSSNDCDENGCPVPK